MITIVSGVPRSGTSLMMQMLVAGGLAPLTDKIRKPDADNPRGYYEWERIKQLAANPGAISEAEGKAVKVVSSLLLHLPQNHAYRIVFVRRPLAQVVASQAEMIRRRGNGRPGASSSAMQTALETHLRAVTAWLGERSSMAIHWVDYPDLIATPLEHAEEVAAFLGGGLDVERMAAQVDPSLFRNR
ncbi:MAG TPA: sulfotransferase domain-containing protein [Bryobacteraceae bacterium]|nr:sulfotransferase domain-containing protein [Bryobacteraceae bacterium]